MDVELTDTVAGIVWYCVCVVSSVETYKKMYKLAVDSEGRLVPMRFVPERTTWCSGPQTTITRLLLDDGDLEALCT